MILSARTRRVVIGGVETDGSPAAILAATRAQMSCTARQARMAMAQTTHGQGTLLAAVQAAVAASNDPAVQIAWEYGTEWRRDDPLINQIGAGLGLTDTQIDALFTRAMNL